MPSFSYKPIKPILLLQGINHPLVAGGNKLNCFLLARQTLCRGLALQDRNSLNPRSCHILLPTHWTAVTHTLPQAFLWTPDSSGDRNKQIMRLLKEQGKIISSFRLWSSKNKYFWIGYSHTQITMLLKAFRRSVIRQMRKRGKGGRGRRRLMMGKGKKRDRRKGRGKGQGKEQGNKRAMLNIIHWESRELQLAGSYLRWIFHLLNTSSSLCWSLVASNSWHKLS